MRVAEVGDLGTPHPSAQMLYICTVFCTVRLVRKAGAPVPRWQLGSLPAFRGNLVVRDEYQKDLGRFSRVADLIPLETAGPRLRLFDVVLLGTNSSWLTLSGSERIEHGADFADVAQTWHVTPALEARQST